MDARKTQGLTGYTESMWGMPAIPLLSLGFFRMLSVAELRSVWGVADTVWGIHSRRDLEWRVAGACSCIFWPLGSKPSEIQVSLDMLHAYFFDPQHGRLRQKGVLQGESLDLERNLIIRPKVMECCKVGFGQLFNWSRMEYTKNSMPERPEMGSTSPSQCLWCKRGFLDVSLWLLWHIPHHVLRDTKRCDQTLEVVAQEQKWWPISAENWQKSVKLSSNSLELRTAYNSRDLWRQDFPRCWRHWR